MSRLAGKVCVVTGASGGIGAATVQRFQDEGATVVGVDLLPDAPGDLAIVADVTDEHALHDLYVEVRKAHGHIDVLFNNAGISPVSDASVLETSVETWQHVQAVNLKSVFLCCKHGIPHLQISYTASKGGVLALTRELGVEFARRLDLHGRRRHRRRLRHPALVRTHACPISR